MRRVMVVAVVMMVGVVGTMAMPVMTVAVMRMTHSRSVVT